CANREGTSSNKVFSYIPFVANRSLYFCTAISARASSKSYTSRSESLIGGPIQDSSDFRSPISIPKCANASAIHFVIPSDGSANVPSRSKSICLYAFICRSCFGQKHSDNSNQWQERT